MIIRHRTAQESPAEETPEQQIIDARTRAVAEKVDAGNEALDRLLQETHTNGSTNGATTSR